MASKQLLNSTVETLGEAGDLTAAPGSRNWAIAVRLELQGGIHDAKREASNVLEWRHLFVKHEGYRALPDQYGHSFLNYRDFCEAPEPYGLGYDPDVLSHVLEERKSAQARDLMRDPATRGEMGGRGHKSYSRENSFRSGGDPDYLASRLKADHEAIYTAWQAGSFKSVRAAAIEAGIVKIPTALDTLRKTWAKASADERDTFLGEVMT